MMKRILICLSLAAMLGACSMMDSMKGTHPAKMEGGVMVGPNGMTLYTFDKDGANSGRSVCVDKCAVNWPPFMASASASNSGDWTVITRPDGSKQWAYRGWPLYYWIKDQKPGDKTGDNVGNVWHVVK